MKSTQFQFLIADRLLAEAREKAERRSMTVSELVRAAVRRELEAA